jgi:hypothetical protein
LKRQLPNAIAVGDYSGKHGREERTGRPNKNSAISWLLVLIGVKKKEALLLPFRYF